MVIASSQAHLTHVSALSSSGNHPYPASYTAPTSEGAGLPESGFLSPFDAPAFASWVIVRPLRIWAFLTVGLPAPRPDRNGVVMLRMHKQRPGRTPALPRGQWCAPDRRILSDRHPPLYHGQPLRPHSYNPSAGVTFTRHQRRFTQFAHHPDGLTAAETGEHPPRRSSPRP